MTWRRYRREAEKFTPDASAPRHSLRCEPAPRIVRVSFGSLRESYARVSTEDQNAARQLVALKGARCSRIFQDKLSGDSLTVWKLDRLGRSLRDLITMLDGLRDRGVEFRSLTEAIDTDTPTGHAMWQMIGVLAELERSCISERTRAGVKAAKNGA